MSKQESQVYVSLSDTTKSRKRGEISPYSYIDMIRLKIKSVQNDYEFEVKNFSYDPAIWFYMTPDMP